MHFTQLEDSLEKRPENPGCVGLSLKNPAVSEKMNFSSCLQKSLLLLCVFFSSSSLRSVSILLVLRDNDCGVSALHFMDKSGVSLKKATRQEQKQSQLDFKTYYYCYINQ